MIINKYQGKTEEEAKAKARESLGNAAVIMNVKEIRPKGLFGIFKDSTYEVTAAIEEDDLARSRATAAAPGTGIEQAMRANQENAAANAATQTATQTSTFNAVVSDNTAPSNNSGISASAAGKAGINEAELKDAFSAVKDVLEAAPKEQEPQREVKTSPAPVNNSKLNAYKATSTTASKPMVPLAETAPKYTQVDDTDKYMTYSPAAGRGSVPAQKEVATPAPDAVKPEKSRTDIEENVRNNEPNNFSIVKMLYNELLDNEVQEKYINQVLDDMDKILATSHSLDNLLSSVYQKMVLKLGRPKTITIGKKRPKVVFFIGPTGVGKTTTIAKLASKFKVEDGRKVGLITTDTYRMAAADQLRTYANILSVPMSVVYSGEELNEAIKSQVRNYDDLDVIFVDTLGFSHKNDAQKEDLKNLLMALDESYEKEVYLVLSATTKYRDLIDITDAYSDFTGYSIIFTKLDETACYGNIYNIKQRTGAQLSYITTGQNVPDDIDAVDIQKLVKQLLGGA